jgi:hypothetical protein
MKIRKNGFWKNDQKCLNCKLMFCTAFNYLHRKWLKLVNLVNSHSIKVAKEEEGRNTKKEARKKKLKCYFNYQSILFRFCSNNEIGSNNKYLTSPCRYFKNIINYLTVVCSIFKYIKIINCNSQQTQDGWNSK